MKHSDQYPHSSFIVTGASASGKTTLTREAARNGYHYLPAHTTRSLRKGESQGVDMVQVPENQFREAFESGAYLEPTLDFSLLHASGIYYGTPRIWVGKLAKDGYCAAPTSTRIAGVVHVASGVEWLHLTCPDLVREERLRSRGITESELETRMTAGDSIIVPDGARIIDSSKFSPAAILNMIQGVL